jgi:putative transposase
VACRVLGVSRSGYYAWLGRPPSLGDQENESLVKQVERVHIESRGTYGWPRVHAELALGLGVPVNHKRVARLMREAGRHRHRPRPGQPTAHRHPHRARQLDRPGGAVGR